MEKNAEAVAAASATLAGRPSAGIGALGYLAFCLMTTVEKDNGGPIFTDLYLSGLTMHHDLAALHAGLVKDSEQP